MRGREGRREEETGKESLLEASFLGVVFILYVTVILKKDKTLQVHLKSDSEND